MPRSKLQLLNPAIHSIAHTQDVPILFEVIGADWPLGSDHLHDKLISGGGALRTPSPCKAPAAEVSGCPERQNVSDTIIYILMYHMICFILYIYN